MQRYEAPCMHRSLDFLRVLAEYRRLHIVVLLTRHEELCVSQMVEKLHLRQADTSHALADLRRARILACRRQGHKVYYSLAPDKREVVKQIVNALQHQFPLFVSRPITGHAIIPPLEQGGHDYSTDPDLAALGVRVTSASF